MNTTISKLSIKNKLLLILIVPSLLCLLFAGLFLIELEITEFQKNTRDDLTALATIIGNRSTAALMFQDVDLAKENLNVLNTIPAVQGACLYDVRGKEFARLMKESHASTKCPTHVELQSTAFADVHLFIYQTIYIDKEIQGYLFIHADYSEAYFRKLQFIGLLFIVLILITFITFGLSSPLLSMVASPIKKLVNTVKSIHETNDYSIRAVKTYKDEIGLLVDAFNALIGTVETQSTSLIQAKNRYRALYDDNPTMIFSLSAEGHILSVNRTGANQLDLSRDELINCLFYDFIHNSDLLIIQSLVEHCLLHSHEVYKEELRMVCYKGNVIWVRITARLFESKNNHKSILLVCEDVTDTHELNEQIIYQASHDTLTGLANRSEFDCYIKTAINMPSDNGVGHALCYLDLDQFKIVNDTCGHLAGDELLRQLGDLLRKCIRRNDFVARLGGDEFGILMYHCNLEQAAIACNKIRDIIKDFQFGWDNKTFTVGVSIGVTSINGMDGNAVDLLKEADSACYVAKNNGRNRVHIFTPNDEILAMRQGEMQWVSKIRQGFIDNAFILYGQLIVPLNSSETGIHFETLVRYKDTDGRIVPPGAFLPSAERYNLACQLDQVVISMLFEWLSTHQDFLTKLSVCSVNLSGRTLSDQVTLEFIIDQFNLWEIPPHKICFEITETAAISNLIYANKFIKMLRDNGSLFSLDDFGSGLSSFGYLKNLLVDYLKIDGLFVKNIIEDEIDFAMVRTINEVGHIMNKQTIAEFVENMEILSLLKNTGVDYAQGYAVSKPIPLDELLNLPKFIVP